jgi:polysaccharide pyruvyl transferase WcaK-like protein
MLYGVKGDYPTEDEEVFEAYLGALVGLVSWLCERGHRVSLFTTETSDERCVGRIVEALPDRGAVRSGALSTSAPRSVAELVPAIARTDVVFATRLHGVILAHRLGVPAIAVSYDRKVDAHMALAGQEEYCLPIRGLTSAALVERFERLAGDLRGQRDHLARVVGRFRDDLETQYRLTLAGFVEGKEEVPCRTR